MSGKRTSQCELPDEKGVSARDIAAVWPCSPLVAPIPVPMVGVPSGGTDEIEKGGKSRASGNGARSDHSRYHAILRALAAIWKNGPL